MNHKKQRNMIELRKGVVKEQVTKFEYLVEDVSSKEEIRMFLSGKMIMNYLVLDIGEEVYVIVSSTEPNKGRLVTETDFKENKKLSTLRIELRE